MLPHSDRTARAPRLVQVAAVPLTPPLSLNLAALHLVSTQSIPGDGGAARHLTHDHPGLLPRPLAVTVANISALIHPVGSAALPATCCPGGHDDLLLLSDVELVATGVPSALYSHVATLLVGMDGAEDTYWLRGLTSVADAAPLLGQICRAIGFSDHHDFVLDQLRALEDGESVLIGITDVEPPVSVLITPARDLRSLDASAQA